MHPLLIKQLRQHMGLGEHDLDTVPEPWRQFLDVVHNAYMAADMERELFMRSVDEASAALMSRNQELSATNSELLAAEMELRKSHEELELRVQERTRALQAAMEQVEAASRSRGQFLAHISHEIRTPMTAILGHADMLLARGRTAAQRLEHVQIIKREGEHLLTILNDILDFSKMDAGKLSVDRIECDPCQIVSEVVSLMRVRALEKHLRLEVVYEGPMPATIRTDPTRVRQILLNLVGNAIKFTETGGVKIVVSLPEVSPPAEPMLNIAVIDTGIGINPQEIASLFRPFEQAGSSTSRRFGGTGLGLSICQRLAELLGGGIEVQSQPGAGSRFTARIAAGDLRGVTMSDRSEEAVQTGSPTQQTPPPMLTGRVLLAEDGVFNQQVLQFYLQSCGLDVTVAGDGQMAVDLAMQAHTAGRPFDVILLDMQMPVLDGYTAAGMLREAGYRNPIVAVTAHATSADRQRCIEAGCSEYLVKPVNLERLIGLMSKLLPASAEAQPERIRSIVTDPDILKHLPAYVDDLPRHVNEMLSALRSDDLESLGRVLHALKGSGSFAGFPAITQKAAEAEQCISDAAAVGAVGSAVEALIHVVRQVEGFDDQKLDQPAGTGGKTCTSSS